MNSGSEKNIDDVKRSFMRMTSPQGFGSGKKVFSSILTMNIPPLLGRASAAVQVTEEILNSRKLATGTDRERAELYAAALELLKETAVCATEAEQCAKAEKTPLDLTAFRAYTDFLSGTLNSLLAIAQGQTLKEVPGLPALKTELQTGNDIYAGTEKPLLDFLCSAMAHSAREFAEKRDAYKQNMPQEAADRFDKARAAFTGVYRSAVQL